MKNMNNLTILPQEYMSLSHIPLIEDLSCHGITIRTACTGSVEIATEPPGASIYIYEESQGDYILQSVQSGTFSNPAIINDIECTSLTRSNKFKLSLLGYIDVEGILKITDGQVYHLNIYMERYSVTEAGGLLIPGIAIGSLLFFLFGRDKDKHKKPQYYEKYKEIYE